MDRGSAAAHSHLIEAEAKLQTGDYAGMMTILNTLRTTPETIGPLKVPAMAALSTTPATKDAAVSLFFRDPHSGSSAAASGCPTCGARSGSTAGRRIRSSRSGRSIRVGISGRTSICRCPMLSSPIPISKDASTGKPEITRPAEGERQVVLSPSSLFLAWVLLHTHPAATPESDSPVV